MANTRVERTAFFIGALRAVEGHTPPEIRLFDDPLAEQLLTGLLARAVRHRAPRRVFTWLLERAEPGIYGGVVCRTRAIDDACAEALAAGAAQVVILGAGLDTRPYRMAGMRAATVWELDLPAVQEAKTAALVRALGQLPGHVRYLPVDLVARTASDTLAAGGFDSAARTLLVCEAVTPYLPRPAVERTLAFAGTLAPGSRVVLTYMPQSVIDGAEHARRARDLGWQTGFDPARFGEHLAGHGLTLLDDLGAAEHQERFLRPRHRTLPVFALERVAVAEPS